MVSQEDFALFKNSEVYGEMVDYIKEEMSEHASVLINRKEHDGYRDMYERGLLTAFQMILEWKPEQPAPQETHDEA